MAAWWGVLAATLLFRDQSHWLYLSIGTMKPTEDQLDQLLSAYLDDALDDDELRLLEPRLKDDSEVLNRLRELNAVRDSVRQVFSTTPTVRLPKEFSTEVLAASVARAYEEGCDESHPLMRVQEKPLTSVGVPSSEVSTQRLIAVALTLAASILLLLFGPNFLASESDGKGNQIAGNQFAKASSGKMAEGIIPPLESSQIRISESNGQDRQSEVPSNIASLERRPQGDDFAASTLPVGRLATIDPAEDSADQSVDQATLPASDSKINQGNSQTAPGANMAVSGDVKANQGFEDVASPRGAVLVLRIKQTDSGRSEEAVRGAMKSAGIRGSSRVALRGKTLEGLVAQSSDDQTLPGQHGAVDAGRSVLFLQLSAKQFDQFYQQVWADQAGVDSLSMSVVFDAPITGLVESIVHDPTRIKAEATSVEIQEIDEKGFLVDSLRQLPLVPMDRSVLSVPSLGSSEDLQTQVLLLVE